MPGYPQLARQITELRKIGDIDGAIASFKSASDSERKVPEIRAAMAWVIYERDIKPITVSAQNADPTLAVTDEMVDTAISAVEKIRVWCSHDLYSKFSAFPTSLLMVAKILKARNAYARLKTLLESVDGKSLNSDADGAFPSTRSQWVNLALDTVKQLLDPATANPPRIQSAEPLLQQLRDINQSRGLSQVKPAITANGKTRKFPSQNQRFILQYTRFLQETERLDELARVCQQTLQNQLFEHDPNLKWILYRLALALKNSDPHAALKACDDFVALEYQAYSLLLRAEILLACGQTAEALREAAHSLQNVQQKDLLYITKNLRFLADLSDDLEVKRSHIQMVRFLRQEMGQPPKTDLEALAQELDLPPAIEPPSFDELRRTWDTINPNPQRRKTVGRSVPNTQKKSTQHINRGRYTSNNTRFGEVIMAKIPTTSGQEQFRPVVVIGQDKNELLVGSLQINSKHPKAVSIENWEQAGLRQPNLFVPFWHIVKDDRQKVLGKLTKADSDRVLPLI